LEEVISADGGNSADKTGELELTLEQRMNAKIDKMIAEGKERDAKFKELQRAFVQQYETNAKQTEELRERDAKLEELTTRAAEELKQRDAKHAEVVSQMRVELAELRARETSRHEFVEQLQKERDHFEVLAYRQGQQNRNNNPSEMNIGGYSDFDIGDSEIEEGDIEQQISR